MKPLFALCFAFFLALFTVQAQIELARTYNQDGQLSAVWYELGPEQVQVIRFYPNGELQEIGQWYQGQMHGPWAMWAENGHKIGEAHYRFGRKTGCWKLWSPAGEWQYDLWYEQDQLVDARVPETR
jgi:antitoxin component YwqK of YwqJK toxin-antitoxin module